MWCMAERRTRWPGTGKVRFAAYLDAIAVVLGDVRRATSARAYCTGRLLLGERKSIEPMAARIEPGRVQAKHQSMHHVVAKAEWDDVALLRAVREQVLPAMERHGPVRYWIVDDTGFPKRGTHSVGVGRQYCGPLGKQDYLPGGRGPVGAKRPGQPADRLPALSAGGLGRRSGAAGQGGGAGGD